MDLRLALTTTGAVRDFTDRPVDDEVLRAVLDDARFAPSGGNRQPWSVAVITDSSVRRAVRDAYLDAWHDYVAHHLVGVTPFAPTATDDERAAVARRREEARALSRPDGFPETLDTVPAMLAVAADLDVLAATDRDLERFPLVAGASVYPFVWSILLAARERGLGGVMTTVASAREENLRDALGLPPRSALAAVVILGWPASAPTRLRRRPVADFATRDRFDGPSF